MYCIAVLTSALALLPQAASHPARRALPGDVKPDRGVVTQPYGYTAFADGPGGPASKEGGSSVPSASRSKPSCVMAPGTRTSFDVCGGSVTPTEVVLGSCLLTKGTASSIKCERLSAKHGGDGRSPEELAQRAAADLVLPVPVVRTAPPRGRDGLVGLPEFFWANRAGWRPHKRRAEAGGVWAQVTATPSRLVVRPGTGDSLTCEGPGTPYDRSRVPADQDHSCTFTYRRSSAGLSASAYRVTAEVVWTATWVGSGGAGGVLPSLTRSSSFPVRVAEAQALIQRRP